MFAISEGMARINGQTINTFEREIAEKDTVMQVAAGTSTYKGEGTRTYVGFDCISGDFHFSPIKDKKDQIVGIEIASCGHAALKTMQKALAFALKLLDEESREVRN